MLSWLLTMALIFALLIAGIGVDRLYRRFAARHPQLGPFRKGHGGCGGCADDCDGGACGR
jgi:hypothetical protein